MTGRPVIGSFLALLVESSHWTKLRWDFNEEARGRAWQMTTLAIVIAGAWIYLEGSMYTALPDLLTWLPPLLLPMQFVQSFGLRDSLPLNTFSFLAKHRRERNLRLGLTESVVHINFGNVYFVITLVAATLGTRSSGATSWAFLPGIIVLTGWMLLSASRSRPLALVAALAVAGIISLAGQQALKQLQEWYEGQQSGTSSAFNPNSVNTMIGQRVTVELSPDIVWRLRTAADSRPPTLLRTASYNHYQAGGWETKPGRAKIFKDLNSRLYEGDPYYLILPDTAKNDQIRAMRSSLPRFSIRGAAFKDTPMPLPGDAASLRDFDLDVIERNTFGTVRMGPKQSVIEGTVLWKGETNTEDPPLTNEDLNVQPGEREALDAVLAELRLDRLPTLDEKLRVIQNWFQTNFRYSRTLTILASGASSSSGISQFLQTERVGHCGYFASATALLLRRAGIPARYAVGYVAVEFDASHKEFVIRGTHGHAWCRVWDAAKNSWSDFDTTPGTWIPNLGNLNPSTQWFSDFVKRLRENFFLWRNRPANRLGATIVMAAIGLGIVGFVVRRLWKSKRLLETNAWVNGYDGPVNRTPLNALEKPARRHLGPRPAGLPLGVWLQGLHATLRDRDGLDEAISLHQQLRFDPAPQEPARLDRLTELTGQLEAALKAK